MRWCQIICSHNIDQVPIPHAYVFKSVTLRVKLAIFYLLKQSHVCWSTGLCTRNQSLFLQTMAYEFISHWYIISTYMLQNIFWRRLIQKSILIEIITCRFRCFNDNGILTQLVSQADSCDVILRRCCLVSLSLPGTRHHVVSEVNQLWGLISYTGSCTKPAQSHGWSAGHITKANDNLAC